MKKLISILILTVVWTFSLYSQNKIIKGRLFSDDLEIVSLATITINDSVKVGSSELSGFFQITIPVSVKTILFTAAGIEPTKIVLTPDDCDLLEVVAMLSGTYDFMTFKKADKIRIKRFKKLQEIRQQAFEKSIFKTNKICYTQEFIPYYERNKK